MIAVFQRVGVLKGLSSAPDEATVALFLVLQVLEVNRDVRGGTRVIDTVATGWGSTSPNRGQRAWTRCRGSGAGRRLQGRIYAEPLSVTDSRAVPQTFLIASSDI